MGRAIKYSAEEVAFIEANHKIKRADLLVRFNQKFARDITLEALNAICKRNGWATGRKAKGGSHYSDEVIQFISDNRDMPRKELVEQVNAKFDLEMTYAAITNICVRRGFSSKRTGRFGEHDGWRNGIAFKEKPIGYEARPDHRGRVYVKVGQPSEYRLKHHVIWEQHFGPIPENHVIKFKDGDDTNFHPSNLICIHRGVTGYLIRRYKHHKASQEIKPVLLTMAQIDHKIYQKEKADA